MDDDIAGLVTGNLLGPLSGLFLGGYAASGVAGVAFPFDGPAVEAFDHMLMAGHGA